MNCDPDSLNRYLKLIGNAEHQDRPMIGVTEEQDGFILAGAHASDAFCWCMPIVVRIPCDGGMRSGEHMDHPQVNHRRTMDQSVLDDDNPRGFAVTTSGSTYPEGQVCIGPQDRPKLTEQ